MSSRKKPLDVLAQDQRHHITNPDALQEVVEAGREHQLVVARMLVGKDGREVWQILANRVEALRRKNTGKISVKDMPSLSGLLGAHTANRKSRQLSFDGNYLQGSGISENTAQLLLLPTVRLQTPEQVMEAIEKGIHVWFGDAYSNVLNPLSVATIINRRQIYMRSEYTIGREPNAHETTLSPTSLQQARQTIVRAEVPPK